MSKTALVVMAIDDDLGDAKLLQRHLQSIPEWAVQFRHFEKVGDALSKIESAKPDVLFVDYLLGSENGLQVIQEVRRVGYLGPLIFLTGEGDEHIASQAFKHGADDYLTKAVVSSRSLRRAITNARERWRLKSEIREHQIDLEDSNRALLRRTQDTQAFYQMLSHELRTPLTSASTFLDLVLEGHAGPLNHQQAQHLTVVRDSHDQMLRHINDLLDASRLQTGKLSIKQAPASITSLVESVMSSVSDLAEQAQIDLSLTTDDYLPEVFVDKTRIQQVLTNLLSNAIKFTPAHGRIEIGLNLCSEKMGWVRVSVKDDGVGMEFDELSRIFDRFYQVTDENSSSPGGLGLGLSIAKQLVDLHDGVLSVLSTPGGGSTFWFTLPPSRNVKEIDGAAAGAGNQEKILVVEDDEMIRTGLTLQLESAGYDVVTAFDGVTGVMAATKERPDLLLLDISMPAGGGFLVAERARDLKGMADVPIIFLTAQDDPEMEERATELGASAFIKKPHKSDHLLTTIRAALEGSNVPD